MPGFVGPWELIILALIVIFIFGTAKLPSIGKQAGKITRKAAREVQEVKQSILVTTDEKDDAKAKTEPATPKSTLERLVD